MVEECFAVGPAEEGEALGGKRRDGEGGNGGAADILSGEGWYGASSSGRDVNGEVVTDGVEGGGIGAVFRSDGDDMQGIGAAIGPSDELIAGVGGSSDEGEERVAILFGRGGGRFLNDDGAEIEVGGLNGDRRFLMRKEGGESSVAARVADNTLFGKGSRTIVLPTDKGIAVGAVFGECLGRFIALDGLRLNGDGIVEGGIEEDDINLVLDLGEDGGEGCVFGYDHSRHEGVGGGCFFPRAELIAVSGPSRDVELRILNNEPAPRVDIGIRVDSTADGVDDERAATEGAVIGLGPERKAEVGNEVADKMLGGRIDDSDNDGIGEGVVPVPFNEMAAVLGDGDEGEAVAAMERIGNDTIGIDIALIDGMNPTQSGVVGDGGDEPLLGFEGGGNERVLLNGERSRDENGAFCCA